MRSRAKNVNFFALDGSRVSVDKVLVLTHVKETNPNRDDSYEVEYTAGGSKDILISEVSASTFSDLKVETRLRPRTERRR